MQLQLRRRHASLALFFAVMTWAALALAGEGKTKNKTFEFARPPATPDELEDAVLDILDTKCAFAGCHTGVNAPQNLDLTEEAYKANLVKVKSAGAPQFLRVKPGDAANSYLIKKVKGAGIKGDRMPRGGQPLSSAEIAALEKWINAMPADAQVEEVRRTYKQAFYGWTLANLQTAETLDKGAFLYRIAHRFRNKVDTGSGNSYGLDNLFGLDGGAFMMTQLAFPITDNLTASLSRQGFNANFEIGAKLRFLREKTDGSMPVSAALYTGVDWATVKGLSDPANANATLSRTAGERFAFFAQLPVTKALGDRFSVAAVPGILLNGNVMVKSEDPLFTLGFGGKVAFNQKYALFAEIVPIVAGDSTAGPMNGRRTEGQDPNKKFVFNDTFVAGFEIKAGGHVFHFFVSNSAGNTTRQYMSGGELDFGDGDMRLGFNIYRILNYPSF